MSDSDDMSLPVPSRGRGSGSLMGQGSVTGGLFSGLKASGRGALASTLGAGRTGGAAGAGGLTGDRGSRRLIMTGSRQGSRQSSWKTSNGSNNGAGVEKVGGEKVCMACGIQFTWRLRRHHCRACKKAVCDPCSKERLLISGGDAKRHRVCYPCVKLHLSQGNTREQRVVPQSAPTSIRSSPFGSSNVSRDGSRHGPSSILAQQLGLAITAEDADGEVEEAQDDLEQRQKQLRQSRAETIVKSIGGVAAASGEGESAKAAAARAMAAVWTRTDTDAPHDGDHATSGGDKAVGNANGFVDERGDSSSMRGVEGENGAPAPADEGLTGGGDKGQIQKGQAPPLALSVPSHGDPERWATTAASGGASEGSVDFAARGAGVTPPSAGGTSANSVGGDPDAIRAPTEESGAGAWARVGDAGTSQGTVVRPSTGSGVRAVPASHQHKRPVQSATDQNPLALPWFTSKHVSPCTKCEDLWKVAWSAREDFLHDLAKAEKGKDYQLVASSGDSLRLYAAGNMLWGSQAIRLRVETEVAVPLGFAMRWLASLTARGGVYYPYSDTVACDILEAKSGALSVACAHWPTQLSGPRRCTVLRYVSEDGTPPPGMEDAEAETGREPDPRPTIVFSTIDHPIMREWALPGVDVEVFPSGLVLEEMDSTAGPVTRVSGLIGWDNKGTLQHMAKMGYLSERGDRLDGLAQHLRAMESGYREQAESEAAAASHPGSSAAATAGAGKKRRPSTDKDTFGGSDSKLQQQQHSDDRASAPKTSGARDPSSKGSATTATSHSSLGSPPIGFSPLPQNENSVGDSNSSAVSGAGDGVVDSSGDRRSRAATAHVDEDSEEDAENSPEEQDRSNRLTSRAAPLSPNRGRDLSGGIAALELEGSEGKDLLLRRRSESGGSNLGLSSAGLSPGLIPGNVPPPPQELEAEVAFLNRQLSVRMTLEEKLNASEGEKSRLITKLAKTKADAGRHREALERTVQDIADKLTLQKEQAEMFRRQVAKAEERAMIAERDLRLAHEALRVQADLARASADSLAAAANRTLSPGASARFPVSNHALPLAASPVLRAPPPAQWGSGPSPSGGEGGAVGEAGGKRGSGDGVGSGVGGLTGAAFSGRIQEMGVKFALDTLKYSEDEEVVVFMLHLVQGLRHEATPATLSPAGFGMRGESSAVAGRSQSDSTGEGVSPSVARALFQPNRQGLSPSLGGSSRYHRRRRSTSWGLMDGMSQLATLLIRRACENEEIANFLFWYLKLEAEADALLRSMYQLVRTSFMTELETTNPLFASALKAAEMYISAISDVHASIKKQGGRASKKTANLKSALTAKRLHMIPGRPVSAHKHPPSIPLPLDPTATVLGLRPATAYTFPSAMSPCVVEFVLSDSVGSSFRSDDLLLDPTDIDGPQMITNISAAGMGQWSGGPLPRQPQHRTVSASTVEEWEFDDDDDDDDEDDGASEGSGPTEEAMGGNTLLDVDEEEEEAFMDRRRISADAQLSMDGSDSEIPDEFKEQDTRRRGKKDKKGRRKGKGNNATAGTAVASRQLIPPAPRPSASPAKSNPSTNPTSAATTPSSSSHPSESAAKPERNQGSSATRRASQDLTKLRLWEQMQVLGAASRERGSYLAIFKNGEDVRQDQLAVHMVSLMDRQLKEAGLDLKLKSYRVLATGLTTGMIEFVRGSVPMSAVLAKHNNSVLEFLRYHNADPGGPLGMKREALDNFTRSCAGSCVVTYLLGVGDRHLDNLMLLPEGVLFHIDFGYLFGKDPKLMPPPFRLTKEMVEAMGGSDAPHYTVFKSLCCQAYRQLRKSAHQYLNLLSLMSSAGIKDLSDDPAAVLQLVQDRFKLDLTDEQADAHFLGLVSQSVTALAPRVLEVMHQIRVAAR